MALKATVTFLIRPVDFPYAIIVIMSQNPSLQYAMESLDGLSVGDAFGELFFLRSPYSTSPDALPRSIWKWTDDTQMAISIVETLKAYERIDQDALAKAFARRYIREPARGYGAGAHRLLSDLASGGKWQDLSPKLFGTGSYGNGAAMRSAPIGGFFFDDLERAAKEAELSAEITHSHIEGKAGAIAVAVATALAANSSHPIGNDFLEAVIPYIPDGLTKSGVKLAMEIPLDAILDATRLLGAGEKVSAQDTVPFCLWSAAHHLDDYEAALWNTAKGLGDVDTTCAIVGGIVALSAPQIPKSWLKRREPLNL